jgi:RNA polymerase sigma factor (sigma-70 family)
MDLEALLRAARDGDRAAWDDLVPSLYRELRAFFRRDFDDPSAVELTQRTVTIVARQLPGFVPQKSLRQWVFGIARNQGRLEHRARARARALGELAALVVQTPGTSPTARIYARELVALLREEIEKLPPHYRCVVEHDLEGGELEALAEREGIEPATARSRRFRALQLLRRQLLARIDAPPVSPPSSPA